MAKISERIQYKSGVTYVDGTHSDNWTQYVKDGFYDVVTKTFSAFPDLLDRLYYDKSVADAATMSVHAAAARSSAMIKSVLVNGAPAKKISREQKFFYEMSGSITQATLQFPVWYFDVDTAQTAKINVLPTAGVTSLVAYILDDTFFGDIDIDGAHDDSTPLYADYFPNMPEELFTLVILYASIKAIEMEMTKVTNYIDTEEDPELAQVKLAELTTKLGILNGEYAQAFGVAQQAGAE